MSLRLRLLKSDKGTNLDMCGIFGFFGKHERLPSKVNLENALSTLSHRGPDAHGLLLRPECGLALGHTRLSIIDPEPRSDQPFISNRCSLIFNGEIYNYKELRNELLTLGVVFRTTGDTEVIIQGYEYWGKSVFGRLRGMFAIAIYDNQEGCLHLARDEFGIKPLCVLQRSDSVIFASEIKAIAALSSLSINGEVLIDMLSWGFQMENSSLYSGVRYLSPGSVMTISLLRNADIHVIESESWFAKRAYLENNGTIDSESLYEVIQRSVDDHLISDVPVALALSGGLDSSIIAAAAAKSHPDLHAYTLTLSSGRDSEVEHASLLCRHLGLKHHVARLAFKNTEGWLRSAAWNIEEPIANISSLLSYGLSAILRDEGFKVAIVGEGADELFAGYPWYQFALNPSFSGDPIKIFNAYHLRRAQKNLINILRPNSIRVMKDRLDIQREAFRTRLSETSQSLLNGFLSFDQSTQLQYSQLLRVDRMFMAHGIEARVPFLYKSVLKASASLFSANKLRINEVGERAEKIELANSFSKYLPKSITLRPKFGENGTVNIWDTGISGIISSELDRCLFSNELRGARQLLDEFIDWKQVENEKLTSKEKFSLALTIEAVDCLLLSRRKYDGHSPLSWEFFS